MIIELFLCLSYNKRENVGLGYRLTAATPCVLILEGACQQDKAATTAHVFLNIFGPNRIIRASKCAATNFVKMSSTTAPALPILNYQNILRNFIR